MNSEVVLYYVPAVIALALSFFIYYVLLLTHSNRQNLYMKFILGGGVIYFVTIIAFSGFYLSVLKKGIQIDYFVFIAAMASSMILSILVGFVTKKPLRSVIAGFLLGFAILSVYALFFLF